METPSILDLLDDVKSRPSALDQPPREPTPFGSPEPSEVSWLWEGVVPIGKLTLLAGDPGVGKSLVTLDLAARVSRGGPFPGDWMTCTAGGTLLIGAEDGLADTVRLSLEAAEASLFFVHSLKAVQQIYLRDEPGDPEQFDLRTLVKAIDAVINCRLVVIDPLSAFLAPGGDISGGQTRNLLTRLASIAAQQHVAILAVTHLTKSADDALMYRPMGGLGIVAAARGAWVIVRDRGSETRWMLPIKENLRASTGGLAFRIAADAAGRPRVQWDERTARKLSGSTIVRWEPHARPGDAGTWPSEPPTLPEMPAVLGLPAPAPAITPHRQLAELIAKLGGRITVRILMRSSRRYKKSDQAEAALAELVSAGLATRRTQPAGAKGGRPVELFEVGERRRPTKS